MIWSANPAMGLISKLGIRPWSRAMRPRVFPVCELLLRVESFSSDENFLCKTFLLLA
jgi:hypothetical protein